MSGKCYVIIGNGFDRAHGAPTSFYQFSDWLLRDYVERFFGIIRDSNENDFLPQGIINQFGNGKYLDDTHVKKHRNDIIYPCFHALRYNDIETVTDLIKSNSDLLRRFIGDYFILSLYENRDRHWFAVEDAYFEFLTNCRRENTSKVKSLNRQLEFLRLKLREYLRSLTFKKKNIIGDFISQTFGNYSQVIFLDFNYTETINLYLDLLKSPNRSIQTITIHGTLREENEIFGYGNDLNPLYQELKELGEDDFLEHSKTVNYGMDSSYKDFTRTLSGRAKFDVYVLGHSLGETDRTLLQEVIDHANCSRIHIAKRLEYKNDSNKQRKSWKKLMMAATRITTSDANVRKKVIPFSESLSFPLEIDEIEN